MAAEDETFRILSRRSLSEIYPIVMKKINYETTLTEVKSIVSMYGYSIDELIEYDEEYTKRKNVRL